MAFGPVPVHPDKGRAARSSWGIGRAAPPIPLGTGVQTGKQAAARQELLPVKTRRTSSTNAAGKRLAARPGAGVGTPGPASANPRTSPRTYFAAFTEMTVTLESSSNCDATLVAIPSGATSGTCDPSR